MLTETLFSGFQVSALPLSLSSIFFRSGKTVDCPAARRIPEMTNHLSTKIPGYCLFRDGPDRSWLEFQNPLAIIKALTLPDVMPALREISRSVEEKSLHAMGFISYEAAPAFDDVFPVRCCEGFPLLWFGLYRAPLPFAIKTPASFEPAHLPKWTPSYRRDDYFNTVNEIQERIASGETYQVNFTFPFFAQFDEDPLSFFLATAGIDSPPYASFLDIGNCSIASFSPELFFECDGRLLVSRPMKGTLPRGRTTAEDSILGARLRSSEKERAENIMIVDMIRNDMGRIANRSSVRVDKLFKIERYPTVLQMTSTISCTTPASFPKIIEALFPCASVTGAPKSSTMGIINRLEKFPRKIYTGAIGRLWPGGGSRFSVAIRTALIDTTNKQAEYHVGGGIVADSKPETEYEECLIKTRVLAARFPEFSLVETILLPVDKEFFLLDFHLKRLMDSAYYFTFNYEEAKIREYLTKVAEIEHRPARIRLLLDRWGGLSHEFSSMTSDEGPISVFIAKEPVDAENPFLYHKTTNRSVYEKAKDSFPGMDDVILWNERGEATETSIGNIVAELNGCLVTPPVECGLLPGVYRASLLHAGIIKGAGSSWMT